MLEFLLIELPRLRKIVVTNFRGRARKGENYIALLQRLSATSLAVDSAPHAKPGYHLPGILRALSRCDTCRITSLVVGERTLDDGTRRTWLGNGRDPHGLEIMHLRGERCGNFSDANVTREIRALKELAITLWYDAASSEEEQLQNQLRHFVGAPCRLETLVLAVERLYWFNPSREEAPFVSMIERYCVFRKVVLPQNYPCMRRLELRGWIFTSSELQDFLTRHKTALRQLSLLECLCGDSDQELAIWAGKTLTLTGARITSFHPVLDYRSSTVHGWQKVKPEEWRVRQSGHAERDSELEQIWLNGRINLL